jgi:SAM-dependent methyltransferase
MTALRTAAFDTIASEYDALWSDTPVGKAQRSAVWSRIDPLFKKGDFVLDLGCGTGVDALHLAARGVSVYGIDSSPRMVEVARRRGIEADCCSIERLQYFDMHFDGVISNFAALNCLSSLATIAGSLARMVRSGGHLALCFLSPVCVWEIAFYLFRGEPGKALRRLRGRADSSMGTPVFYPSERAIVAAFQTDFRLLGCYGVGLFVPPSYVTFLIDRQIERLSTLDHWMADKPVLRSLADHRLYIFERI